MNKINKKQYLLVGDLQYYATPYVSLYTSKNNSALHLFVRTSEYTDSSVNGLMVQVTAAVLQSYLKGKKGLSFLMKKGKPRLCNLNATHGIVNWSVPYKNPEKKIPEQADLFNDEFCVDYGRLSYFLRTYN